MYNPDDFEVPLDYSSHKNPIPPMQKVYKDFLDGKDPVSKTSVFLAEKRHIQESMALTAGMITMIDDAVGSVISTLKKRNLYENTTIIFTSDHGDYMGGGIYYFNTYSTAGSVQTNAAQWVGIAQSTVSDGASVTIDLPGGVNDQQSGMTIEGQYYVNILTGAIQSTSTDYKAGVALSATQLLVADNTANATAGATGPTGPAGPTGSAGPTGPTGPAGAVTYSEITSATTAVAGNVYIINTGSAVTLTLPASASIGDKVGVVDGTGQAATNNITIGRNSHKIQGDAADMTVSLNRAAFELVYYNATHGWLLTKV